MKSWGTCAGHSWFQNRPIAEPTAEFGGISGKTYLRKGRKHQREKGKAEKSEKQQREHQDQRRKPLNQTPQS